MSNQYVCELYFDREKGNRVDLTKLALQSLGFMPNIMSIYVNMDEMYEEVPYNEDLLFTILSKEVDSEIKIAERPYDENRLRPWFRLGEIEGNFFPLKWSNENLDFLIPEKIKQFLKVDGFAACYIFDNKDAWEQSTQAKDNGNRDSLDYPGQFKYVSGMQFMAAPLMWFGSRFFGIIGKAKLLEFAEAQELKTDLVEVNLFNIYDSPQKNENRAKQRSFWSFFDLDKIVARFEEDNNLDAAQSLRDFLARTKSRQKSER
jgi:hypothetical protein